MSVTIKNLTHIYMKNTPFERKALDGVNIEIEKGEFVSIIGHTGSGKSTLIQHINGLLKPEDGSIIINGVDITEKTVKMSDIRKKVGLVFQYPEYQLFEETIEKEIAFGPSKLGLSDEETSNRVKKAMNSVGISYEMFKEKSPFDLSGGQKRRVAIASVIAMEPEILILDEPTAGLDPKGRDDILALIKEFQKLYDLTVIFISHSMEEVAKIADRIIVMESGRNVMDGAPKEIFAKTKELEALGLGAPKVTYLMRKLKEQGYEVDDTICSLEEAAETIKNLYLKKMEVGE